MYTISFAKSSQHLSNGIPELFNTSGFGLHTNPICTLLSAACTFSFLFILPICCCTKPLVPWFFFFLTQAKSMPIEMCARWVFTSFCHAAGGGAAAVGGGSSCVCCSSSSSSRRWITAYWLNSCWRRGLFICCWRMHRRKRQSTLFAFSDALLGRS